MRTYCHISASQTLARPTTCSTFHNRERCKYLTSLPSQKLAPSRQPLKQEWLKCRSHSGRLFMLTREKNHGSIMSLNEKSWSVMDVALGKSFQRRKCLVTIAKGGVLFSSFAAQICSFATRISTPLHSILPLTWLLVHSSLATQPSSQSLLNGVQG